MKFFVLPQRHEGAKVFRFAPPRLCGYFAFASGQTKLKKDVPLLLFFSSLNLIGQTAFS